MLRGDEPSEGLEGLLQLLCSSLLFHRHIRLGWARSALSSSETEVRIDLSPSYPLVAADRDDSLRSHPISPLLLTGFGLLPVPGLSDCSSAASLTLALTPLSAISLSVAASLLDAPFSCSSPFSGPFAPMRSALESPDSGLLRTFPSAIPIGVSSSTAPILGPCSGCRLSPGLLSPFSCRSRSRRCVGWPPVALSGPNSASASPSQTVEPRER